MHVFVSSRKFINSHSHFRPPECSLALTLERKGRQKRKLSSLLSIKTQVKLNVIRYLHVYVWQPLRDVRLLQFVVVIMVTIVFGSSYGQMSELEVT